MDFRRGSGSSGHTCRRYHATFAMERDYHWDRKCLKIGGIISVTVPDEYSETFFFTLTGQSSEGIHLSYLFATVE
eukprot:5855061-Amphidinium_carterae.1